jgi:hypothetical protein
MHENRFVINDFFTMVKLVLCQNGLVYKPEKWVGSHGLGNHDSPANENFETFITLSTYYALDAHKN